MAIATYAAFKNAKPHARATWAKSNLTVISGRPMSRWVNAPFTGAAPTTAAACDATTAGGMIGWPSGLPAWIKTLGLGRGGGGTFILADRLSHQGGLSAIVTGAQTTNLPTAALTRYTSGVGVMAAFEIYTQIGATITTITASYTNSAGTSGRTSPAITWGGANERNVGYMFMMPLQVGDVGVRSVESVNIAVSTGTAGAFGVTLFKPLVTVPWFDLGDEGQPFDMVKHMGCFFEAIQQDACLFGINGANGGSMFSNIGYIDFIRR